MPNRLALRVVPPLDKPSFALASRSCLITYQQRAFHKCPSNITSRESIRDRLRHARTLGFSVTINAGHATRTWQLARSAVQRNCFRRLSMSSSQLRPEHKPSDKPPVLLARQEASPAEEYTSVQQSQRGTLSHLLKKSVISHENIYTIPNILTFSRLIAAPAIGYMILHDMDAWAAGLFAYAGITDLVDGWIARRFNMQTVVGTVIDPLADKTLMTILTVCLAAKGALPVWLAVVILGRDISLAISAIYYRFASLPPPKTLARYWNFSLPSAEVHPTFVSKVNTALQLLLIGAAVTAPVFWQSTYGAQILAGDVDTSAVWLGYQYLVGATTAFSGLSYLWTKNAVTFKNLDGKRAMEIVVRGRAVLGVSFVVCLVVALLLEQNYG